MLKVGIMGMRQVLFIADIVHRNNNISTLIFLILEIALEEEQLIPK